MAMIAVSPCSPHFYAAFLQTRTESTRFASLTRHHAQPRLFACRLKSFSGSGGYVSPENGDIQFYELQHGFGQRKARGTPVFVTLPLDTVGPNGQVRRKKAMAQSFRALSAAGVEGVVMEVWWGLVEMERPGVYNWQPYLEIMYMAKRFGLKVRAVMAFHQHGSGPEDPNWIPLPQWVLEETKRNPDITYCDRFGRRNKEYISLGCDTLPVLRGRTPIQVYSDFMRNFRDTFLLFLGVIVTGIQVGLGPAGELRYPSCSTQKLTSELQLRELGEFQCYDKYMLASLDASARSTGMNEWGSRGLLQNPEETELFRSDRGSWDSPYGKFFLEWYSGMLLLHGERICRETETLFRGTQVYMSAKLASMHWQWGTQFRPSELTAGYYSSRDGLLPIARMFGRYRFTLCYAGFEMQDGEEKSVNPVGVPGGFLQQLLLAARTCNVPLEGENYADRLDDGSYERQVQKMSKFYSTGLDQPYFSFNFVRMDKNLFDYKKWVQFTRFVRQMSDNKIFRARLDFFGSLYLPSTSNASTHGLAFSCV